MRIIIETRNGGRYNLLTMELATGAKIPIRLSSEEDVRAIEKKLKAAKVPIDNDYLNNTGKVCFLSEEADESFTHDAETGAGTGTGTGTGESDNPGADGDLDSE